MQNLGPNVMADDLAHAGEHWGLLMATGILLIVCGMVAIFTPFIASGAAILLLGFLMVVGGLAAIIGGIRHRSSGGLAFYLVTGILAMVAGIVILRNPAESLLVITWLIAIWLLVAGIFRFVSAFFQKEGRGWLLFGGAVSGLLGLLLLSNIFVNAIWFLGFAVGIEMIFAGWSWLAIGLAARSARELAESGATPPAATPPPAAPPPAATPTA
jgi:uncharacterized membrane protein HdeD (DUF308 family)